MNNSCRWKYIFLLTFRRHSNDEFGPSQDSKLLGKHPTWLLGFWSICVEIQKSILTLPVSRIQDPLLGRSWTWFSCHTPGVLLLTPAHVLSLSHLTLIHEMQTFQRAESFSLGKKRNLSSTPPVHYSKVTLVFYLTMALHTRDLFKCLHRRPVESQSTFPMCLALRILRDQKSQGSKARAPAFTLQRVVPGREGDEFWGLVWIPNVYTSLWGAFPWITNCRTTVYIIADLLCEILAETPGEE